MTSEYENAAPRAENAAPQAAPKRRIGSFTLGLALIACGVCLLLYYFLPGFDFGLVAKLAPVFLIALGGEVLYFAARPEKGRYSVLSILLCLALMCCAFGASLLPALWDSYGPERYADEERLENQLEQMLYEKLRGGDVSTLKVSVNLHGMYKGEKTLQDLDGSDNIWIGLELTGPYESPAEFAAACRSITDAVQTLPVTVESLHFAWLPEQYPQVEYAQLDLYGPYQADWDAATMAGQVDWGMYESGDPAEDEEWPEDEDGWSVSFGEQASVEEIPDGEPGPDGADDI